MVITYGTGRIWEADKIRLAWLHAEFFPIAIQMHLLPPPREEVGPGQGCLFGPRKGNTDCIWGGVGMLEREPT